MKGRKIEFLITYCNKHFEIDSANVVPGDIIVLESGTQVSADARILSCNNLTIDELKNENKHIRVWTNLIPGTKLKIPVLTESIVEDINTITEYAGPKFLGKLKNIYKIMDQYVLTTIMMRHIYLQIITDIQYM